MGDLLLLPSMNMRDRTVGHSCRAEAGPSPSEQAADCVELIGATLREWPGERSEPLPLKSVRPATVGEQPPNQSCPLPGSVCFVRTDTEQRPGQ